MEEFNMLPVELVDSLSKLHAELETSKDVDPQTLNQVRELDKQLHEMLKSNELKAEETMLSQLLALEAKFAAEHPTLERITRDVIDRLAMMGV
ncbi:DUF4404 family protein [Psychrosphaera haliotis]|uniref:DUF4404 family protein n=2 Tax=Psychrosphaera haliotis TaxID=555083 RepID=A0A6N8FDN6_9GAMM|nr:DUF4404 family protein [Psychrosphaera haliotis]